MKSKLNNVKAYTKAAMFVAALSVAGLAGAGFTYSESLKKVETAEVDAELTTKMVQAVRCNLLLKELGPIQAEDAKKSLTSELAFDVERIKELSPEATSDAKEFAGFVVTQLTPSLRKTPDSRIASNDHASVTLVAAKGN